MTRTAKNGFLPARPALGVPLLAVARRVVRRPPVGGHPVTEATSVAAAFMSASFTAPLVTGELSEEGGPPPASGLARLNAGRAHEPNEYVDLSRPPRDAAPAGYMCEEPARWSAGDDTEGVA